LSGSCQLYAVSSRRVSSSDASSNLPLHNTRKTQRSNSARFDLSRTPTEVNEQLYEKQAHHYHTMKRFSELGRKERGPRFTQQREWLPDARNQAGQSSQPLRKSASNPNRPYSPAALLRSPAPTPTCRAIFRPVARMSAPSSRPAASTSPSGRK